MDKLFLAIIVMLTPSVARGDGVAVRLRQASGPFLVTVFTAPDPLQAGPIDASVLVQDQETSAVILDATVNLEIRPVSASSPDLLTFAKSEPATNKLLQAARIDLPAGSWILNVSVSQGRREASFATNLRVVAAKPRLTGIWPLLLVPPLAIGLFTLHQMLRHPPIRTSRKQVSAPGQDRPTFGA